MVPDLRSLGGGLVKVWRILIYAFGNVDSRVGFGCWWFLRYGLTMGWLEGNIVQLRVLCWYVGFRPERGGGGSLLRVKVVG